MAKRKKSRAPTRRPKDRSSPPRRAAALPTVSCEYLEEPSLLFGAGREHVFTRTGLGLFGPRTLDQAGRHPSEIRVGFVGSGQSIDAARSWVESCLDGVKNSTPWDEFPGFREDRGFFSRLVLDDNWVNTITQHELAEVAKPRLLRERFQIALQLVSDKLKLLSERDQPPAYVVLALPDTLLEHCRVVDYQDSELGQVHRDFRRALKAEAMKSRLPTQILLQRTTQARPDDAQVDPKWKCAWNFFTTLYFKAGGIPWSPTELSPGSCYVGVSFFRPLGSARSVLRSSVAQAFDEHGDGLVFRGQDFRWDETQQGPSPHLDAARARNLLELVLKRYEDEMGQKPKRVVIHKTSRFWPEEREGFQAALEGVSAFDLLSVCPTSEARLLRAGQYPPLRGTHFQVGDTHFLYTTGFIPALNAYPHGHVPSPLQVADHVGDSAIKALLQEVLVLTKMNWNSASFAGLMPMTLRFSRLVGDIMREVPDDREPLPGLKYYT